MAILSKKPLWKHLIRFLLVLLVPGTIILISYLRRPMFANIFGHERDIIPRWHVTSEVLVGKVVLADRRLNIVVYVLTGQTRLRAVVPRDAGDGADLRLGGVLIAHIPATRDRVYLVHPDGAVESCPAPAGYADRVEDKPYDDDADLVQEFRDVCRGLGP